MPTVAKGQCSSMADPSGPAGPTIEDVAAAQLAASGAPSLRARHTYIRRRPEQTVLHQVVGEHLETFLAETRLRGGGEGLPRFVERELREFLTCGVMARGFARFRCSGCKREILVAFSCKGRGFCPSCCGRRMCALAAHLVDGVLGGLPVRQWVLTLPYRLRYRLAYDHRLCRAVLAVFVRAVLAFERRRAREQGIDGRGGAVTAIQRCGSALNTNIHFHTLVAEGVFELWPNGSLRFVPAPAPPTNVEVARLLVSVRRRIVRLVRRHGIELDGAFEDEQASDPLSLDSAALAAIRGASVIGRVATGPRAGQLIMRLGSDPTAEVVTTGGPRHAHREGFDLHANAAVPAGDRKRLEHLCRYVLRPPVAQDALELTPEGKVLLRLRRPWRDGTRAIRFEPTELLEKLAAMIPRPRANLLIYHGAFAPRGCCREGTDPWPNEESTRNGVTAFGGEGACAPAAEPLAAAAPAASGFFSPADPAGEGLAAPRAPPEKVAYVRPLHFPWAELLRRVFEVDILACPDCGNRLRLVATIENRAAIERILAHLGLPIDMPTPAPARSGEWRPGVLSGPEAGSEWLE